LHFPIPFFWHCFSIFSRWNILEQTQFDNTSDIICLNKGKMNFRNICLCEIAMHVC
jgi:hypothetical protein